MRWTVFHFLKPCHTHCFSLLAPPCDRGYRRYFVSYRSLGSEEHENNWNSAAALISGSSKDQLLHREGGGESRVQGGAERRRFNLGFQRKASARARGGFALVRKGENLRKKKKDAESCGKRYFETDGACVRRHVLLPARLLLLAVRERLFVPAVLQLLATSIRFSQGL